jgi:hypothetical protein
MCYVQLQLNHTVTHNCKRAGSGQAHDPAHARSLPPAQLLQLLRMRFKPVLHQVYDRAVRVPACAV